jgi:hypothetical protein
MGSYEYGDEPLGFIQEKVYVLNSWVPVGF